MEIYENIEKLFNEIDENNNRSMNLFDENISKIKNIIDDMKLPDEKNEMFLKWQNNRLPLFREYYKTNTNIPFETDKIIAELLSIIS